LNHKAKGLLRGVWRVGAQRMGRSGPGRTRADEVLERARTTAEASARHGVSKVNLILGGHSGREGNYTAQCGTLLPCTASPRQKQTERRLTLLLRSGPFTGACI
jgi:hypothetical protein